MTPEANLLIVKLIFNSIVSTLGSILLGLDLKDFYLNIPMDDPEYLKMNKSIFPDDVIAHYAKVARSVTPSEVTQIYLVCDWL